MDLGFEPTEDRALATISMEMENGDIEGNIVAVGPKSNLNLRNKVYVEYGCYNLMTIRGYRCILFKESCLKKQVDK